MDIKEVSAIIELDKRLREDVDKAEKQRDEIDHGINARVKELHDRYYAALDSEIAEYEEKKKKETEKRIVAQAEEYKKQLVAIDEKYAADKNSWLDRIVGAVTEV